MARIVSKRLLDEIRFQNDIVQVIGTYINLQRAGSGFKALCPFHKEKTPSFHVHPQRQLFHCFGCGAGGDVFRFVMQYENVDFMTAVRMLAQRAGVALEFDEAEEGKGIDKARLYELHAEVAAFYRQTLMTSREAQAARHYLEKRALDTEITAEFGIGYAPNRWDTLVEWARRREYPLELLELGGLVLQKTGAGPRSYYDRFRNRLMFPIADEQGRVIGFSGRLLEDDPEAAKYVNSPETPLFKKSRVLFALDKARKHIVETREAVLCEGQIDVIRCHQAGCRWAVASQGTALTEDHVHILRRYADSVCLVFDPDRAGQDAVTRVAGLFLEAGMAVRVAALPPKEDPDVFIRRRGPEAFRKLLKCAGSVVAFQIETLSQRENIKSEVGMMRVARAALATIARSPNAVQRAQLVQEAAGKLGLPASALHDDLRRLIRQTMRQTRPGQKTEEAAAVSPPAAHPPDEVALCEHLAHMQDAPELAELVTKYLPLDLISDVVCRELVRVYLEAFSSGGELLDVLRSREDLSGELQRLAAQVELAPTKVGGREFSRVDAVKDLILRLWQRKFEHEREELMRAAPADASAESRRQEITSHLHHLRKRKWEEAVPIIEIEMPE